MKAKPGALDGLGRTGRIVLLIAVASMILHMALAAAFSHTGDFWAWLGIMQNVETGDGIYGPDANYYAPLWGYLLSAFDMLAEGIGAFPVWGDRFTDLIPIEDADVYSATLASPGIAFAVKTLLSACDILAGWLVFRAVRSGTGDDGRALAAMAAWCFFPAVVYLTAVQGQFDVLSVILLLVCLELLRKDAHFLAGIALALSVWFKIFPAFAAPALAGYVWSRHSDDGRGAVSVLAAAAGFALATALAFLPQLLTGEIDRTFAFLTDRLGARPAAEYAAEISVGAALLVAIGWRLSREGGGEAERDVFLYSAASIFLSVLVINGYQYAPIYAASMILFVSLAEERRGYALPIAAYAVLSIASALLWLNYSGLAMGAGYYGWGELAPIAESAVDFYNTFGYGAGEWQPYHWVQFLANLSILAFAGLAAVDHTRMGRWIAGPQVDALRRLLRGRPE